MQAIKILLLVILLTVSETVTAQIGITAVPFLEINGDARSRGLAGADVAKISRNGLFLNPAALGPVGTIQLTSPFSTENETPFFSSPWLRGYNVDDLWFASPKLVMGFDKLVVGYQFNRLNLGQQRLAGELYPRELTTFNSFEVNHGLSFAFPLSRFVNIGAGFNYIKSDLASGLRVGEDTVKAATQLSVDLGVYGQRPFEFDQFRITPSIGWSLTDFGYGMKYIEDAQKDPLPITMRGGLGLKVDIKKYLWNHQILSFAGYGALSKIMARKEMVLTTLDDGTIVTEFEAVNPFVALIRSWEPYCTQYGQDYLAGTVCTEKISVSEQFRRHSGFEATFMEMFTVRFGHYYEDENNGDREYDTVGFGIVYEYLRFDYAEYRTVESDHPLSNTKSYQLSVNIPLEHFTNLIIKK